MQSLRNIAAALGGSIAGRNSVLCPGPGHSRKDRSLKVTFKSDDSFSVTSFAGDGWRECKDYVRGRLGLPNDWRHEHANDDSPTIILRDRDDDEPSRMQLALKRWETSIPISGTLAGRYLATRGLDYSGDAIRFRGNDRTLVALMTSAITAEPTGVHCTYLDCEGKKLNRKMFGRAAGSVVRLSPDKSVALSLAVAEGIETALAVPFRPVWACLSVGNMAAFPVLSSVECLTIFADNDASGAGLAAAKACAERWHAAGREVWIRIPVEVGVDYATKSGVA